MATPVGSMHLGRTSGTRTEAAAQSRLTLVAILTLALGICTTIAAFTVIRAVLLNHLVGAIQRRKQHEGTSL